MKPMFCADVTVDKNNEIRNGDGMVGAKVSEETAALRDGANEVATGLMKKSNLPFPLFLAKYLLGAFFLMVAVITLTTSIEQGFATVWGNAPVLIVIAALCGVAALGILLYEKSRKNAVEESGEQGKLSASLDDLESRVKAELEIPENAPAVDVLQFNYKVKEDGSIKVSPMQVFPYLTFEARIFIKEDKLCLADWDSRYEVPMDALKAIQTVDKSVAIPAVLWTKPVTWKEEPYTAFRIKEADGTLTMKPYYILTFTVDGEEYGIYFPPYELPHFEAVTGLKASE